MHRPAPAGNTRPVATVSEPADPLTAFGSRLVDVRLRLREELARLRQELDSFLSGGARPAT